MPGVEPPEPTRLGEVVWLEPCPDALFEAAVDVPARPRGAVRDDRIDLAGVRDRPAAPASSPARGPRPSRCPRVPRRRSGRNARLDRRIGQQRARSGRAPACSVTDHRPSATATPPVAASAPSSAVVASFVRAYESADLDAVVALLTDDVFISMPPMPFEYEGRDAVARFFANLFGAGRRFDLVADEGERAAGVRCVPARSRPTSATGSVSSSLTLAGDRICAMTRFENSVLPWFGLPRSLHERRRGDALGAQHVQRVVDQRRGPAGA